MRFRRSFSRKGSPREPLFWQRRLQSFGALADSLAATRDVVIFDPTADVPSAQDGRVTLRKLIVEASLFYAPTGGTLAANDQYSIGIGIYMRGVSEPARNPLMAAATDQSADWLWLQYQSFIAPSASFTLNVRPTSNLFNQDERVDIKSMRKLNEDQVIALSTRFDGVEIGQSGHTPGSVNFSARILISSLWQRTMRRK